MKFTLTLADGSIITGEIVGDGGMVASLDRAQKLVRYRIRHHERLEVETWRDQYTGKYERVAVKPALIASIGETAEKGKVTNKEAST